MGLGRLSAFRAAFLNLNPATSSSISSFVRQLDNLSIDFPSIQSAIRASNIDDTFALGARIIQDQADLPANAAKAIADSGLGKQVAPDEIRAINEAAEASGDVASKTEQLSIAQKILNGFPLAAREKGLILKITIAGGTLLLVLGGLLTWMLIEYRGMDKARFEVTAVFNVKELDEATAGLLEFYESGEDLADFDPDNIPKPEKNWHILRIEYRYPDEDFRISHGHEIETNGTDTSPSIDQTRYVVMNSGKGYVDIAAPFELSSRAGEAGSLTIHYNLDYQLAALAENIKASVDNELGPDGDDDDDDDNDNGPTNPFQDIEWGWLIVGVIVLVLAMLIISMVSRSRPPA